MSAVAHGTFDVTLTPEDGELDGRVSRVTFTKTFDGDLLGSGRGVMLSGGDPAAKAAGYVAIETFDGSLHHREGGFSLQQFGTMAAGATTLEYVIVPGSGVGSLQGIAGTFELTIEPDGTHRYALEYEL